MRFPVLDLCFATAEVFIDRNVVPINQFRVIRLDEKGVIFRIMLTALGTVIAEMAYVCKAHHVIVLFFGVLFCGKLPNGRIEVVAVLVPDFQQPGHVIDTGNLIGDALGGQVQTPEKCTGTHLHTVAKPYGFYVGEPLHISAEHCHEICVV